MQINQAAVDAPRAWLNPITRRGLRAPKAFLAKTRECGRKHILVLGID